jgi:hypothetical protein
LLAAVLIALAGSGTAADLVTTLTVVDRNEVRARAVQGQPTGYDAATTPGARLDLTGRRVSYALSYFPSFALQDLELGVQPQVFQTGSARVAWIASRELRLSFSEDGTYGRQNYSALSPTPTAGAAAPAPVSPPAIQLVPGAQTILTGSARTAASLELRAARFLTLTLAPSYFVGGGLDSTSQASIPLQSTPHVQLGAAYTLERRSTLTWTLGATDSRFSAFACDTTTGLASLTANGTCAPHDDLVESSMTWRRQLTREDDLALAAGFTATYSHVHAGDDVTNEFPTGSLTWNHHLDASVNARSDVSTDLRVAPVIDLRSGIIDQRAQARLAWVAHEARETFSADLVFTQSLPPSEANAVTFAGTDLEALFGLDEDRRFDVGAGYRGAWQEQQGIANPFFTNVVYAVLVYHEPAIRLSP